MSIAIRANQSGVDQAAAQKAAEKKGHQDVVKSVNAGGFLRKNDTQSQIEARRNNAKKQALKVVSDAWKSDNKSADSIADMEGLKQSKVSERYREYQKIFAGRVWCGRRIAGTERFRAFGKVPE